MPEFNSAATSTEANTPRVNVVAPSAVNLGSDLEAALRLRAASMNADVMAQTLFDQEPPLSRHLVEKRLRLRIRVYWEDLLHMAANKQVDENEIRSRLEKMDRWVAGRLSGQNVLTLAKEAEEICPNWIAYMPRLLASRYEELRVARLWSALLNPEALNRLRAAIEIERTMGAEGGLS